MLDKLGGVFTTRPSSGPHKLRSGHHHEAATRESGRKGSHGPSLPRGLHGRDPDRTNQRELPPHLRREGTIHRAPHHGSRSQIQALPCEGRQNRAQERALPLHFRWTHDPLSRSSYPGQDSIRLDINTGKIMDSVKFDTGNLCMVTGGRNTGRVGVIMHRERHPGSFDIVHVKDSNGHTFATRLDYTFVIGKDNKPYISLPKGGGIKLTIAEERDKRLSQKA
ncbi:RP-S4e [Lepeophtheirus salmonis]|uniref:40S ribosomal protein S4 n=1 Tax=Lepeophtheirus salmonis TaxID=72036 RepID=A0A7R8H0W9_LEPSM|nr:RP-S4e [Lepeophtheirus salmonis]CAF2797349.1 RP-S4e [Lepeophtheirus salmonis]